MTDREKESQFLLKVEKIIAEFLEEAKKPLEKLSFFELGFLKKRIWDLALEELAGEIISHPTIADYLTQMNESLSSPGELCQGCDRPCPLFNKLRYASRGFCGWKKGGPRKIEIA